MSSWTQDFPDVLSKLFYDSYIMSTTTSIDPFKKIYDNPIGLRPVLSRWWSPGTNLFPVLTEKPCSLSTLLNLNVFYMCDLVGSLKSLLYDLLQIAHARMLGPENRLVIKQGMKEQVNKQGQNTKSIIVA